MALWHLSGNANQDLRRNRAKFCISLYSGEPRYGAMKQLTGQVLIGIFFSIFAVLALVTILSVVSNLKLRRIRKERVGKGFTRDQFINSFRTIGVPETIAAAVFDYYSSRGVWKDFPFSPHDTYAKVLYDDQDDIEDDTRALVDRLGMQFPAEYVVRESGNVPPQTLRDMVLLLLSFAKTPADPKLGCCNIVTR